jgi:hypothetical protein
MASIRVDAMLDCAHDARACRDMRSRPQEGSGPVITETESPRSRRALLTAALGATVATVAAAVGRPLPVQAANGDAVTVGGSFSGTLPTAITNTTGDGIQAINSSTVASGLYGHASSATGTTYGVFGRSDSPNGTGVKGYVTSSAGTAVGVTGETTAGTGVYGLSPGGIGVAGQSTSGVGAQGVSDSSTGVNGVSNSGVGVYGSSNSSVAVRAASTSNIGVVGSNGTASKPAILGFSEGSGTGVQGYSGSSALLPTSKPKAGVYGHAAQDATSRGVWGSSPAGYGVYGESSSGRAVQGVATTGIGVRAAASSGVGLLASATTGYALRTDGKVKLDKSAGLATIASGTASIAVTPGIDLTATSGVVATLNGSAGGSTAVKRVAINATTNVFTIYLTANAIANVKVAWLVLG